MARRVDKAFASMKKHAEKMRLERTGLVPTSSEDYVNLKAWYSESGEEYKEKNMEQNIWDLEIAKKQNRELARVFGGKTIGNGNVGVLGLHTIWARNWSATEAHPSAPWPSLRELREEGDERYTSNYGRYLPIPRVAGNPTVMYKQQPWNPVEALDRVMPVPKLYEVVNINAFGYFDIAVDEQGVPYDDDELPGKEYFVEKYHHTGLTNSNSIWYSNTKVSAGDRIADSNMNEIPAHKSLPSRFRPEATPFVAQGMKGYLGVPGDHSKKSMEDNLNSNETVLKKGSSALLESTNVDVQSNTRKGPNPFGYVGMKPISRDLENDPCIGGYLKEPYTSSSVADMSNDGAAGLVKSNAMFNLSPKTAYITLQRLQSGSNLNNQNRSKHSRNMEVHPNHARPDAVYGFQAQFHETENTMSPMGFATFPRFQKPASFSAKSRANKPASLNIDNSCITEYGTTVKMDTSSAHNGVKLGAAKDLA